MQQFDQAPVPDDIQAQVGTLSNLTTTEKSNLVGAVNEVKSTLTDQITTKTAGTVTPSQDTDSTKNATAIYKVNNTVYANLVFYPTTTANGWLTVGTITSAFRPSNDVYFACSEFNGAACGGMITTGGSIRLMKPTANTYYYGSVVYVKS